MKFPGAHKKSAKLTVPRPWQKDIVSVLPAAGCLQLITEGTSTWVSGSGFGNGLHRNSFRPLKVVIAGGGTGGHLFPGIAVSQEFKGRNPATEIVFVSTGNRLEKAVLAKAGFELRSITAAGIKGRGLWNQLNSVMKIPAGILQANNILKNLSPDLVIGLGSYSAGPVVFAAWLRRIPVVIQEQNILPGITNRILARFARRIYVSFENTRAHMAPAKVLWTGNPVRRELLTDTGSPEETGADDAGRPFTVLVVGGSQGAHKINLAIMEALEHFDQPSHLHFIHQTGEADEQTVQDAYRSSGIGAEARSFFDNMAAQYGRADLIVCRAGATTVAEVTALGKAVVFIPFPFAADDHQTLNAGCLVEAGAAEIILEKDLDGKILAEKIKYYVGHPAELKDMAGRAVHFGKPDAARQIVDDCYRLLEKSIGPI